MLSDEDKRRIEAEEAYRASLRGGDAAPQPSQVNVGMKREAGSFLFRFGALCVIFLLWFVGCALVSGGR